MLRNKLYKIDLTYIIKLSFNPIEPNVKEVEEFGYKRAKILSTIRFRYKVEYIVSKA